MSLQDSETKIRQLIKVSAEDQRFASAFVKYGMVLLGTAMAGAAQFMDTPDTGVAWNRVIGFIGVVIAFFGGMWSNRADRHAASALQSADVAIAQAKAISATAERLRTEARVQFEAVRREHAQIRQLLALINILREGVERVIVQPDGDVQADVRKLLLGAYRSLLASMRCEAGERWTVTIYQEVEGVLEGLAACTVDRGEEDVPVRSWPVGQGYAGAAFARDQEVVLADAQSASVLAVLHVPVNRLKQGDAAKYRSVAAVPIRVAGQSSPWGVVIVTSDQLGRFDASDSGEGATSAQAVRILAGMVALIVASEIRAPRT